MGSFLGTQKVNLLEQNFLHACCHSCQGNSIRALKGILNTYRH